VPPLSKPYRCAVLLPEVAIEGPEGAVAHEVALVVWSTCIDLLQRHPGLAVYDAEATPLVPRDGHFAPEHAVRGALPTDAFFAPTRRDELVWLELALPRGSARMHALARSGERDVFDASGRNIGDQLNQLLGAWLAERKLAPLARRCEPVTVDELLAIARAMAPALAEQARNWVMPSASTPAWLDRGDEEDAPAVDLDNTIDQEPVAPAAPGVRPRVRIARQIANKLPRVLRAPALRLLELALHDDLADLILEVDPEHPQALFAKLARGEVSPADHFAVLRRVIAAAPGWARPYSELAADRAAAPSPLEITSGTGIAALCRPGQMDVVDAAARQLCVDGRADEAVRLMKRVVRVHADDPTAHVALLHVHAAADRVGAWLAQAQRSARAHGCPAPGLPWYPDQIHVDLLLADALLACGRLDEAIALRANRLAGREATWPRHVRTLATWRRDPRYAAWCHAREGAFRGDPARVLEGFGRIEPDDSLDVAMLLDALVALGRESETPLAWAHHGLGRGRHGAVARLAAARSLLAAGAWRSGLEELWRVELGEPGRDEHTAIARCGRLLASLPIEIAEAALGERVAIGAITLAKRMARDVADFVPAAAKSSIVLRALGRLSKLELDLAALERFGPLRGRAAIDALFDDGRRAGDAPAEAEPARGRGRTRRKQPVETGDSDALARGDRLVERWLAVAYASAGDDDPAALARAAAYVAAQALGRYLCATTAAPSPLAGALRTVAAEALALVACHRDALGDRDALALLGVLDPLLRRVDRWVGTRWLAAVERACGIDERAHGDVAGFVGEYATVTARVLGPEEAAVLASSVARLHRDRPDGWDSATAAQAERLALHTGHAGVDEWAEAIVSQLAARTLDADDAIDMLHTACYLAEGTSALPSVLAARVLFDNGRGPAALAVLTAGLGAARPELRDREIPKLAKPWRAAKLEVPFAFEAVATGLYDALQKRDPARAEKLGRWAVAFDPENAEAHRNLGLALAQQGKLADALVHLVRAAPDQATEILASVLYQASKLTEAMAVLDYASRWYTRAEQWLAYGGIAYAALETARAVKAYTAAYELDQDQFDASQLNAFAGVLDELGEHARCQQVAEHLLRVAGDDATWKTAAWNHLASAYIAQRRFEEAEQLAARAIAENPMPDNAAAFQATLERARAQRAIVPTVLQPQATQRDPAFAPLDTGDFEAAAARIADPSWRVRRAALGAMRFRAATYDASPVPARARAAAERVLADTCGAVDAEAVRCRALALEIRAQAQFARDPLPQLPEVKPATRAFVDRVVVPNTRVARIGEYVALLRDLAALPPREALAQFDLDDAGYLETAKAWAAAIEADPTIATMIGIGLAKR
jgi:tetratricopeptide (TPR) repeat protein